MLLHSANLNIYGDKKDIANKTSDLYNFILEKRCINNSTCKSDFKYSMKNFELYIENNSYNESWVLEEDNKINISIGLNLDIQRENPDQDICLEPDRKFILILLEKKMINVAYFPLGLPKKKKKLFSSKYNEGELMGCKDAIFLKLFLWKFRYNKDLIGQYNEQVKRIVISYCDDLTQGKKIIKLKYSEFDIFFNSFNTPFSKELMQLVKK